ncbi:DNA/RNA non-specific endonuclease, partial [Chitinimonas sp. PSY-7]|uniref:DNA/RNA non-specific endonuclease n=1 Tax=Chitinimonas sp. PSY-7 TaxID=3459088 RepID=UPI00403FF629
FGDVLGNSIAGNGRNWVGPAKPVVAPVSGSSGRNWLLDDIPDVPSDVYRVPGRPEADVDYGFSSDDAAYTRHRFSEAAAAQSAASRKQEQEVARVVAGNRQREAAFANALGDRILNTPLGDLPSQVRQGVAGLTKSGIAQLQDMVTPVPTLSAAAPFLSSRPRYEGSENLANYWMRSNPGDMSTSENARMVWENSHARQFSDAGAPAALAFTAPGIGVSAFVGAANIGSGVRNIQEGNYLPGAALITEGALTASPFAVKAAPYAANGARWAWNQAGPTLDDLFMQGAYRSGAVAYAVPPKFGASSEAVATAGKVEVRNGYSYRLDEIGRVEFVEANLVRNPAQGRNIPAQLNAGGKYRLVDDQGGHYIGRRFNGPLDEINHFAQNGNFNMGAYKALENSWDTALKQNIPVRVQLQPSYTGESLRPDTLHVRYWVDEIPNEKFFYNRSGGK